MNELNFEYRKIIPLLYTVDEYIDIFFWIILYRQLKKVVPL